MESLDSEPGFMDELLNFSSDIDEEEDRPKRALASSSSLKPNGLLGPLETVRPFHEYEEDLEWISNKDAFPAVESFVGILSDHHPSPAAGSVSASKHHSPVSVLDGSTITMITTTTAANHSSSSSNCSSSAATALTSCFGGLAAPRRARSKRRCRRRRGDVTGRQLCWSHPASRTNANANVNANANAKMAKKKPPPSNAAAAAAAVGVGAGEIIGRKCQHCGAEKTPQWRAGPYGPKTLCNACGVRYKSGRLVPEYRPASSPSFSTELHSNSHRKILEMRRVKQAMGVGVKQPLESG